MAQTKRIGGIEFRPQRGLRFKKKLSPVHYCVRDEMSGKNYGSRSKVQEAFVKALILLKVAFREAEWSNIQKKCTSSFSSGAKSSGVAPQKVRENQRIRIS